MLKFVRGGGRTGVGCLLGEVGTNAGRVGFLGCEGMEVLRSLQNEVVTAKKASVDLTRT